MDWLEDYLAWLIIIPCAVVVITVTWACHYNKEHSTDMEYLLRGKDNET